MTSTDQQHTTVFLGPLAVGDPALWGGFVFWTTVLALKTALMSFLPTVQPFLTKVNFIAIVSQCFLQLYQR